jgi:hypothetical protein
MSRERRDESRYSLVCARCGATMHLKTIGLARTTSVEQPRRFRLSFHCPTCGIERETTRSVS